LFVAQMLFELFKRGTLPHFLHTECLSGGPESKISIADCRKQNQEHPIRERIQHILGNCEAQTRLADARWTNQRKELSVITQ
jgi:hypothetical protein